jgi:8-oxo-dGTP diphosphatase
MTHETSNPGLAVMAERETAIVTVDIVLLTLDDDRLKVALMARPKAPFEDRLALPGGYVHTDTDRDADAAARRILQDKLGFAPSHMEQLETVSGPSRDPRGWSVSIVYVALIPHETLKVHSTIPLHVHPVDALPALAFDHNRIVGRAVARLRSKGTYSTLPCHLLPARFTIPQMHQVFEQVLDMPLNRTSFTRKMSEMGILEPVGKETTGQRGRSAAMYRLKEAVSYFQRPLGDTGI